MTHPKCPAAQPTPAAIATSANPGRPPRMVTEAEQVALLLTRASVYSRLDITDPLRRHQVAHPFRPIDEALTWELGTRAAHGLLYRATTVGPLDREPGRGATR